MTLRRSVVAGLVAAAFLYSPQAYAWASLAIDGPQGHLSGTATDQTSEEGARAIASMSCGSNCRSVVVFRYTCAAYAADQTPGSSVIGWAYSPGQETAQAQALNYCRQQGGTRCQVRVWACEQTRNRNGSARLDSQAAVAAAPRAPAVAPSADPDAARRAVEQAFARFASPSANPAPPAAAPQPAPPPPVAVAPPPPPPAAAQPPRPATVATAPAALPGPVAPPQLSGNDFRRVALVIGNDSYQNLAPLQKAVNDSRAIGDALTKIGFDVVHVENAPRRLMNQKLVEFAGRVGRGDTAFFFYSGHGVEIHGRNFLLPVDMPQVHENEEGIVTGEGIPSDTLIDQLQARGAKLVMVVLDACRENPFAKQGTRGIGAARGGLAETAPPEGVFVLYSAGVGQTALDRLSDSDANPNSVFTRKFIQVLATPGLTVQQVATQTRAAVHDLAATVHHPQMPAYYDQVLGQFTLSPVR
jgi:hypothetical protein